MSLQQGACLPQGCAIGKITERGEPFHAAAASDDDPRYAARLEKPHELAPVCLFPCLIRMRGIRMQGYGRNACFVRELFQQALPLPDLLIGKPNVGQELGAGRGCRLHGKGITLRDVP